MYQPTSSHQRINHNGGRSRLRVGVVAFDRLPLLGLRTILEREHDLYLVGEASTDDEVGMLLAKAHPQVVLLELRSGLEDPITTTRDLSERSRVLIWSPLDVGDLAQRLLRAGAKGILASNVGRREVITAIRTVGEGRIYLSKPLHERLTERYLSRDPTLLPEERLSDREVQVMRSLALGETNREIAARLFISVKTVDTHRANLLRKLNLRNNSDVTRFAIRSGFISC